MQKNTTPQPQPSVPTAPVNPVAAMPIAAPPIMPEKTVVPQSMDYGENQNFSNGGTVRDFFSDVNIIDVAISAFIIGGVLYSIHYFKFIMMLEKTGYTDMSSRMAKLESAMTAKQAEANATGRDYSRGRRGM